MTKFGMVSERNRTKKNILFVDDDPLLLDLYTVMVDGEDSHWKVNTAGSGPQALEILAPGNFDVVVSDMRMPGMNGIELMTEIRQRHPQTSRIIISGLDDQEEIALGLETTHQFIAKPIKLNELLGTLTRIGELDAYLQDEKLRALVGRLSTLPSFPSTYVKIMRELAADDPDVENIADIIVKDPALTAKVLQVANSAAFGLSQRVSSPFEAVQFLGLATVRSIALAAHVFASFELASIKGFSARQIWDDALHCSQITRTIMQQEEADSGETEDACAAALLRNTGLLLLALNLPQQFQQVMTLTKEQGLSLLEAEEQIFGANHTGIAAYLFGLWGLSAPMVEAVAFHLQPTRSEVRSFSPLTAVHVAHVFTGETFPGKVPGMPAELNQDYLAAAGVDRRLELWRAETEKLFAKNA